MGIISIEQTERLLWLGRYSERVYTTLRLYSNSFDFLIDGISDSYQQFCKSIDIPDVYGSKERFNELYPFDEENPDSIISNLNRAYDNAIVLREEIGSESLSYVQLAIYGMNKAKDSKSPIVQMQQVIDNILAFWGMTDDSTDSEQVRNIIKTGKRIERVDLLARLEVAPKELKREILRLKNRIETCVLEYDKKKVEEMLSLVDIPTVDYYKIVSLVETLI